MTGMLCSHSGQVSRSRLICKVLRNYLYKFTIESLLNPKIGVSYVKVDQYINNIIKKLIIETAVAPSASASFAISPTRQGYIRNNCRSVKCGQSSKDWHEQINLLAMDKNAFITRLSSHALGTGLNFRHLGQSTPKHPSKDRIPSNIWSRGILYWQ